MWLQSAQQTLVSCSSFFKLNYPGNSIKGRFLRSDCTCIHFIDGYPYKSLHHFPDGRAIELFEPTIN